MHTLIRSLGVASGKPNPPTPLSDTDIAVRTGPRSRKFIVEAALCGSIPAMLATMFAIGILSTCNLESDVGPSWPQGEQGPAGAIGPQGKQCVAGPPGAQGSQGPAGGGHAPLTEPSLPSQSVAAGSDFSCAITPHRAAQRWGGSTAPVIPPSATLFAAISAGSHACGIKTGGAVVCWGSRTDTPAGADNFAVVSVGFDHACGLKTDATLICWGDNTENESDLPTDNSEFGAVEAGKNFTCAAKASSGAGPAGATPPTGS